jgi:Putative prokaryotic signal transducing protein
MAEVFATIFQAEALVVKSLIESTGIEAEISSEHFIDVYPIFFPQEGGIKIVVAEEDAEDARAVIAQYRESKTGPASKLPI